MNKYNIDDFENLSKTPMCPEHGFDAGITEDGLCETCRAVAVGRAAQDAYVHRMLTDEALLLLSELSPFVVPVNSSTPHCFYCGTEAPRHADDCRYVHHVVPMFIAPRDREAHRLSAN